MQACIIPLLMCTKSSLVVIHVAETYFIIKITEKKSDSQLGGSASKSTQSQVLYIASHF